jgi:hypothetical protein
LIAQPRDAEAGEEVFNRLAMAIFAFQFDRVPIYRRVCERRGIIPDLVQQWSEIPTLPTAAFKEHVVSSIPGEEHVRVFHSSGTTGQTPSRHFHSAESMSLYEASLLSGFEKHFALHGAPFIFLTPPPAFVSHSSLVHMFETVSRHSAAAGSFFAGQLESDDSWSLDFGKTMSALRGFVSSSQPVQLLGTAFSFVHLLDYLAGNKIRLRLPAGTRLMETGGYKGRSRSVPRAELRRLMRNFLGVPDSDIVTEYGMSELSSQAYDRPTDVLRFPPWVRTSIISAETGAAVAVGGAGLLRVFDLANLYSVMAIQTEDLAVRHDAGFELLGRAVAAEPRGCSLMATN